MDSQGLSSSRWVALGRKDRWGIYQENSISRTGKSWFCIGCGADTSGGASQGPGGISELSGVSFVTCPRAGPSLGTKPPAAAATARATQSPWLSPGGRRLRKRDIGPLQLLEQAVQARASHRFPSLHIFGAVERVVSRPSHTVEFVMLVPLTRWAVECSLVVLCFCSPLCCAPSALLICSGLNHC